MCMFKIHCTYIGNYYIIKDVYIAKAGFGLLVFLTPPPKCWGYSMCHSLCPDNVWENLENRASQDSNLSTATISLVKKCWSLLTRPAMISKWATSAPVSPVNSTWMWFLHVHKKYSTVYSLYKHMSYCLELNTSKEISMRDAQPILWNENCV